MDATTGPGEALHIPVLREQAVGLLTGEGSVERRSGEGEVYLDGTVGAGGHAEYLLEQLPGARLIALDRDAGALACARARLARFEGRVRWVHSTISRMGAWVEPGQLDGILLDLGVSSMQLDEAGRGFSFRQAGRLDMRMDRSAEGGLDAAWLVNRAEEAFLADLFHHLGEERGARRAARAIVEARRAGPIDQTTRLAEILGRALGGGRSGLHPATRCFQAIRIYVNDELREVAAALEQAEGLLRSGGRLVVISFHSLEDRVVKRGLARRDAAGEKVWRRCHARPIRPDAGELRANPRARSARMRAAVRRSGEQTEAGRPGAS